jgi:predicted outer membrane repeat protein
LPPAATASSSLPGTYSGSGNHDLLLYGRAITVRSTTPADPAVVDATIIDCAGQPHAFDLTGTAETRSTVLDGLHITGASGGGIHLDHSSPTIRRCLIAENVSDESGAGIYCNVGAPLIEDCRIMDNDATTAPGSGGGIGLNEANGTTIRRCQIVGNHAQYVAGGFHCAESSDVLIEDCRIADNTVTMYSGGGLFFYYFSQVVVRRCLITGNTTLGTVDCCGAGACVICYCSAVFDSCVFADNHATHNGGAIHANCDTTLRHCTIVGNTSGQLGGALAIEYGPTLLTCEDTILWDNRVTSGQGPSLALFGDDLMGYPTAEVRYSDVAGGEADVHIEGTSVLTWGDGNIDLVPLLADPAAGDFHLTADSPCIDAGDPAFVPTPGEPDFYGKYRVWDGDDDAVAVTDMGADEFASYVFGDLNCDGRISNFDLSPFVLALLDPDGYAVEYPDCLDLLGDLNGDGLVNNFDIGDLIYLLTHLP